MILLTNPVRLYGRSVVTDLAMRTGVATPKDYSCTLGLNYLVQKLWSGEETFASLEMLFSNQVDFDADVTQPHLSEDDYSATEEEEGFNKVTKYNPAVDKTDFDKYYRRLEDVASQYLENYVSNLVYTVCRYSNNGAKSFESEHLDQPTLMSVDDGEEFTELADLQLYEYDKDWSPDVKQAALTKLPYVMKRLHNLSCYCRVHMLSFIVAFLKAKEKNINARISGSVKSLKKNAVILEGVYLCDEFGNATKLVTVQSKNVRAAKMFDWIMGVSDEYKSYYMDYLNFVHYCKVLNVDLEHDDMTKYNSDFMSKLVVTTVTPNKQYNQQVFDAILSNTAAVVKSVDESEAIVNTINTFNQISSTNSDIQDYINHYDHDDAKNNLERAISIYNTYCSFYKGTVTEPSKYSWVDGFLYYDGNLAVISTNLIGNESFEDERCLISEIGYCLQVTNGMGIYVLSLYSAVENMLHKLMQTDSDYKCEEWRQLTV